MSWLANQLSGLILKFLVGVLDTASNLFIAVMNINGKDSLNLFWGMFLPRVKTGDAWWVFVALGLFTLYMILMFQIMKSFMGPLSQAEHPLKLIGKTFLFSILVVFSADLCGIFFELGRMPFQLILSEKEDNIGYEDDADIQLGSTISSFTQEMFDEWAQADEEAKEEGNSAGAKVVAFFKKAWAFVKKAVENILFETIMALFNFLLVFAIAFNYIKFIIEVGERYVLMGLLSLFSPLCIATGISDATSSTFKSWFRIMISQVILMIFAVFFLKVFHGAVNRVTQYNASSGEGTIIGGLAQLAGAKTAVLPDGKTPYHPLIGFIFLLSWLRLAARVDNYLGSLGITTLAAGDGLFGDLLGGAGVFKGVMRGTKGALSAGKAAGGFAKNAGKHGFIAAAKASKSKAMNAMGNKAQQLKNKFTKDPNKRATSDEKIGKGIAAINAEREGVLNGKKAAEAIKAQYGNTKIDGTNKTVNDLLADGASITAAQMDKDGATAVLKDKDGRAMALSFGKGDDKVEKGADGKKHTVEGGKHAKVTGADPESAMAKSMQGKFADKEKGDETKASDVLKTNNNGDPSKSEEINNNKNGDKPDDEKIKNVQKNSSGEVVNSSDGPGANGAPVPAPPIEAPGTDGEGVAPMTDEHKLKGNVDDAIQDGAAEGKAVASNGEMADVSGKVDKQGNVKDGVKVHYDEKGAYITGNNNERVPVAQFGKNGYRVDGFQQSMRNAGKAVGFDQKLHDISNLKNADGTLDKSKLQKDSNGNHFYQANDAALIPADKDGNIESVNNGISQSGMALTDNGNIANISSSLNANGTIDTSKATKGKDGTYSVQDGKGNKVGVNMSTGGVMGLAGDNATIANAVDTKGNTQDVSSYVGANGKVNPALLTGESGNKVLDLGNGVQIVAADDGTLNGIQVSQGSGFAGEDINGQLHNCSGSIDQNTGLAKPEAIQQDDHGKYIVADDQAKVRVNDDNTIAGATSKGGAAAAVVNSSTGEVSTVSKVAAAAGGFALGAIAFGGGGSASISSDTGTSLQGSYGYTTRNASFNVANNTADYVSPECIDPVTGTISPSALVPQDGGGYAVPGINGGFVPVSDHGGGVYTPMMHETYNPSYNSPNSSSRIAIDIPEDSPLLSQNYTANSSLESGYNTSKGSLGGFIKDTGGNFRELSASSISDDGNSVVKYDSNGSADPNGNFVYTKDSNGVTQLTEMSGQQTYNKANYSGPVCVQTSDSGGEKYREISSDGMNASGGVRRFDSSGNESSTGSYVLCSNGEGESELVKANLNANNNLQTYEKSLSFGDTSISKGEDGKLYFNVNDDAMIKHFGNGISMLQNGDSSYELVDASLLGKDAAKYPTIPGKDDSQFCLVPNSQFHASENPRDFIRSLSQTPVSNLIFENRDKGSGHFSEVSSVNRAFGKEQSGDALFVDTGKGGYQPATFDQVQDDSIPKFTQRLANGTGNVQSVFNQEGNQKVTDSERVCTYTNSFNAGDGVTVFSTSRLGQDDDGNNMGYALVPLSGQWAHQIDDIQSRQEQGQDFRMFTKGGQKYCFMKVSYDQNNNIVSGFEHVQGPSPEQNSVFGRQVKTSIDRISKHDFTRQIKENYDNKYFRRK